MKKTKKYKNVSEGWCECEKPENFSAWNTVTWIPANYGYQICINCLGVYPREFGSIEDWKQEMKIRRIVAEELSKYSVEIKGILKNA